MLLSYIVIAAAVLAALFVLLAPILLGVLVFRALADSVTAAHEDRIQE